MRHIFIGDIHGCYDEFMLLIDKIQVTKNDVVYLVGDIINKGPKSYEVLDFVYKNKDQYKCILGNNEVNFYRYLDGHPRTLTNESLVCFKQLKKKLKKKNKNHYIDYIRELPTYIETDDFLMIHGGLVPGIDVSEQELDQITRLREYEGKPWHEYYKGDKKIIYGHWALQGLKITENTIGLDSGCVYGKTLTAYILETEEYITQKALKPYVSIGSNKFEKWLYATKWYLGLIK